MKCIIYQKFDKESSEYISNHDGIFYDIIEFYKGSFLGQLRIYALLLDRGTGMFKIENVTNLQVIKK